MKRNKEIFVIQTHSVIDVITNSSTELFSFSNDKTTYEIKNLIKLKELEYPAEHPGYDFSVYEEDAHYYDDEYYRKDEMIESLEKWGYTITPPANPGKCICVSVERGTMHPALKNWIVETFNAECESC